MHRHTIASIGAAGAASVGAYAFAAEPYRVTITRHRIGPRSSTRPPLRLVQLSDLHLRRIGPREQRIARAVARIAPDLIVITGDSLDRGDQLGTVARFLALLDARTPKLSILGNWEHATGIDLGRLRRIYAEHNCRLLCNQTAGFHSAAGDVLVTGVDDLIEGAPDLDQALAGVGFASNRLLLAHCPAFRDDVMQRERGGAAPEWYVPDLILSGHTHGGQVTVFGAPLWVPRGSGSYLKGWYRARGYPMYVSRGLGTSGIPARLGAPPEIACFDWTLVQPRPARSARSLSTR